MKKAFSNAESDQHAIAKYTLYHTLRDHQDVSKCEMERNLGTVKPDISAYVGAYPVAFEIQVSPLSVADIIHRTQEYTRKGIYVLWLCANYHITGNGVTVDKWMRFLSGLYYGWMYFPQSDGHVLATKTKPTKADYYSDYNGGTRSVRTLKTRRDVLIKTTKHIVEDFKPMNREAFREFPEARLWLAKDNH